MKKNNAHNRHIKSAGLTFAASLFAVPALALNLMQFPPGTAPVPGNLLLTLSVEFPTGLQASYPTTTYNAGLQYEGYFDKAKCYTYDTTNQVFLPSAAATSTFACANSNHWGGNLLNWLTMTNLDQFRLVMTGGTRDNFSLASTTYHGDTSNRTVLIRARSDRASYNPNRTLGANDPVPLTVRNTTVTLGGQGTEMRTTNGSTFNIRVEVCKAVPGAGIEAFCNTKYPTPKPEGLIQEYADRLRVGAMGYLKDDTNNRNGAVIRAAINDTRQEWDALSGIQKANPYPADATASAVTRSGLINYLNNFGYFSGYKALDPVSELYYAALLYLRGRALPDSYTANLTSANLDSFPAIRGSDLLRGASRDPILNSCQKNFVLGLGDLYTHCDGNLPGGSTTCPGGTPTDPDGLNVTTLWNTVTSMEGTTAWTGGSNQGRPYIAGLAHWANTQDIRSDIPGKQTVRTYWVDVLENGNGVGGAMPAAGRLRTQYWLATKYGGFDTDEVSSNNPNSNPLSWDNNNDGIPDNWFAGNTPTALRAGLTRAFNDIASRAGSTVAGSSGSDLKLGLSGQAYLTGYDGTRWKGDIRALQVGSNGSVGNVLWDGGKLLDQRNLGTSPRRLLTHNGSTPTTFKWTELSAAQQTALKGTDDDALGQARLNYLLGDRSQEAPVGSMRQRDSRLGSLVNSVPVYMPPPSVSAINYSGRRAFITSYAQRRPVLFVGSNGGMLHAFDASNTGGNELFAYVPRGVYSKLRDYTSAGYQHQFMVDGSPMVGDAQINSEWRSVLVGTLGLGGRGFFVLNVTDPNSFASATPSSMVLFDRTEPTSTGTDQHIGHIASQPAVDDLDDTRSAQIVKLNNGQWAAVLGNGVNSASGQAVLLIQQLDAGQNNSLLHIPTNGSTNNGLGTPRLMDLDGNGTADIAYAGDLQGNLWSFDLTSTNAAEWSARFNKRPLFVARTAGNAVQPIIAAPYVMRVPRSQSLQVAFGSGRLMDTADAANTTTQSLYSVRDNFTYVRNTSGVLTLTETTHIDNGRASLVAQTSNAFSGNFASTSSNPVDYASKRGWFLDLNQAGERHLANADVFQDSIVRFKTMIPPPSDSCDDNSGNGRYFATYLDIFQGSPAKTSVFGLSTSTQSRVELQSAVQISIKKPEGNIIVQCKDMNCKQDGLSSLTINKAAPSAFMVDWRRLQ